MTGSLPYRTCNGDCSFESVWFDRRLKEDEGDENGRHYEFAKTAFRPYDLAVTAFLLIAKHHLGEALHIGTDGRAKQWEDAQRLCAVELGYGTSFEEVVR